MQRYVNNALYSILYANYFMVNIDKEQNKIPTLYRFSGTYL